MKKFLALIALVCGFSTAAAAVSTNAFAYLSNPGGGNWSPYCYSYEAGRLAQDQNGYWFRCSFTGQGPTGYQWWRIG